ncbi:MAG: DUF2339 domain-containing protein [Verrucomicrobia bacterium]|nr:DUF2339 domain-containing protein [Verrucomicrobiota bacterium]
MEGLLALILLAIVLFVLVFPLMAFILARKAGQKVETLEHKVNQLEADLARLRSAGAFKPTASGPSATPRPATPATEVLRKHPPASAIPTGKTSVYQSVPVQGPKPPPPVLRPTPLPAPPAAAASTPPASARQVRAPKPPINWEQFMGVKLFAWVGGVALFLAVVFFVKYSFEHNLIPPEVRVALGFLAGLGLLGGGVLLKRKAYAVTSQTLISTGVLILYASAFAAHGYYHFAFFGVLPTFLLMTLVTATAFVLAVRLNAMVVAILGMLGGFLTPVLLSTGVDNPLGLFGYIALLDIGLLAVALNRRWFFLAALAALGTACLQIGWTAEFFRPERYFEGYKVLITMSVLAGFSGLYLGATGWARRRGQPSVWFSGSTLALLAVALGFTAYFLAFRSLSERPALLFSYLFLVDLGVLALVGLDKRLSLAQPLAGLGAFLMLAGWTAAFLSESLLNVALIFYLLFAILHTAAPPAMNRWRPGTIPAWSAQGFPPLALALVLVPILQLTELSFLVWPFVLLVDVLAIGLAVVSASLLPLIAVVLLTLVVAGVSLMKIPMTFEGFPLWLMVLGFFSVLFVWVGSWFARRLQDTGDRTGAAQDRDSRWFAMGHQRLMAAQLPGMSAALPFLLLIMAVARLPLQNPSPVFGLALLLVVLLLGVTRLFRLDWMCSVGLACSVALETVWHFNRFDPAYAVVPLVWYLVFFAAFAVHPFLFRNTLADRVEPWAVAALSGPLHFFLIHRLVKAAYPNPVMGLLPMLFAVPALLSLVLALKQLPADHPKRTATLAWFGGVALFFITLIFPIQFDRQWITIGWALEGAALLWLFHRLPHNGLKLTGTGLLLAAFARLAINPAVLEYHARSATAILNWYLYAYGIVAACLFVGARLLAAPRHRILQVNVPPVFLTLGTILVFLLVNIEIADYFTAEGSRVLTFKFSGHFGRDMTYTIAWGLFAFGLLVTGILRRLPAARWSAIGLLGITMLKLFFHDLAQLEALYRIGAFVAVALIAIGASFAYQRFFAGANKPEANPAIEPTDTHEPTS